jgi:hypothetical protein
MWAERIKDYLRIPPDFGLGDFPSRWSGPSAHNGSDGNAGLKKALVDKTQAGLFTLYSGVLIWAAARLETKTDVSPLKDLAVALFCLQQDNSYYRPPEARADIGEIDEAERYVSTVLYLMHLFFQDRMRNGGRWPLYPNFVAVAKAITLTRYHMGAPQRAVFDPWLKAAITRVDVLAPFPQHAELSPRIPPEAQEAQRAATMGTPIPPQALDLTRAVGGLDFPAAWTEFLTTVEWPSNRYLNPPHSVELAPGHGRAYAEPR